MPVNNLMKDIVINTLNEVLKKEAPTDIASTSRDDIIAYVLNRVPPKYVTSERGLLYGILDARYKVQERIDVLFLIYEAINKILNRRDSAGAARAMTMPASAAYLPHIVGQVLEDSTLSMIPGVEVTLMFGGKPAAMIDSDWENPYRTNESTKGHFHFWPKFADGAMKAASSIPFTLSFRHPDFTDNSVELKLDASDKSDFGVSRFIPTVLMTAKHAG